MKCKDLMTAPVRIITQGNSALAAACLMREHRVGFLPVCDVNGCIVGVVTERDLAVRVCAENELPVDVSVERVMTRPAITLRPEQTVAEAKRQMLAHRHAVLPLIDAAGHPVGVLSLWDIFDAADGRLARAAV